MTASNKIQPIHWVRYGKVRAGIWQTEGGFYRVSFGRFPTDLFGPDDLPMLINATKEAQNWILKNGSSTP